ncbi:MAG: tRNA pseudouridine(38-40) synthase TruA [Leptospiraceae bacterium]|nr:tRNA pseudouridine(38-40) synthase TruA [Leptospiraceae bacterium]
MIQYEGSSFHGFQKQNGLHTVQESLEKSIETILREKVTISAAGRTDSGVHAKGMIVSFTSENSISNYEKFLLSINALTPDSITCIAGKEMPEDFHARFSCTEREYEYLFYQSKYPNPFLKGRAFWINKKIDKEKTISEMQSLIGKHEFKSFTRASSLGEKSSERRITHLEWQESLEEQNLSKILIRGTGFLHNMVRILVGTILGIGSKNQKMNLKEILLSEERANAGKTLPAYALYFLRAYYSKFPEINSLYEIITRKTLV